MALINLKSLIDGGKVRPGETVVMRRRQGSARSAKINADGTLTTDDGKVHRSPSGAAKHLVGRSIDGWTAWRLPDGRTLDELREKRTDPRSE